MSINRNTIENLKKVLKVSERIKLDMIRDILELDQTIFNKRIIDWAEEYGFIIDGDFIIVSRASVDDFINALDRNYEFWEQKENIGFEKLQKPVLEPSMMKGIPIRGTESSSGNGEHANQRYETRMKCNYLISLGRRHYDLKNYRDALKNLKQARKLCHKKLFDPNKLIEIDALIKIVNISKLIGHRDVGITHFDLDVLQTLETQTRKKFTLVGKYNKFETRMVFLVDDEGLREIGMASCKLYTLPESIGTLSSLKELYLSNNNLRSLPKSIDSLSSLNRLDLARNKFTTLPEFIGNLTSLQHLSLNGNDLTSLPESIGNLRSLRTLSLDGNKFTTFPECIGNLTALQHLSLNGNNMASLPESIGNLTALQHLSLNRNKFTTFPESIGNLRSLRTLSLKENYLISLPESIGNLRSLRTLSLDGNNLKTLPESLLNMNYLHFYLSVKKLDSQSKLLLKKLRKIIYINRF